MTESEIIIGNDEICQMIGWVSTKAYVYQVPNLFPYKEDTGWTEFNTQDIGFHCDWNLLIPAYNIALKILAGLTTTQAQLLHDHKNFIVNYGCKNFFHLFDNQLHISSCWVKLVDFSKWYNSVKQFNTVAA